MSKINQTDKKEEKPKKKKLNDLYPQRALIEEARKKSSLIQANDWIDHSYYEELIDKQKINKAKMIEKYSPKKPEPKKPEPKKIIEIRPLESY